MAAEHERQRGALHRRHQAERLDFSRYDHALTKVEKRELRSLATSLKREQLRALIPEQDREATTLDRFAENVRDIMGGRETASGGDGVPPLEPQARPQERKRKERERKPARDPERDRER